MEKEEFKVIKYSGEELELISEDKKKLTLARDQKESPHNELDGMTYTQYHESNEKAANTFIEPKKDKYDNNFQSGTIRTKIRGLLTAANSMNYSPDVSAWDTDMFEINKLGNAIEHIIYKTEELEVDEEKKIIREWELLKHGDIFIEEVLAEKSAIKKILSKKFEGKIAKIWTEKFISLPAMPERNIINGLGMFLGDIRQPKFSRQPFIFTAEVMPYSSAEAIFGKWDRWKYVPKKLVRNEATQNDVSYGWNITDVGQDEVEIIRKQEKSTEGNTYTIYINGILMTPVGLPFLWKWDDYNIIHQGLEPISTNFAYHKSIPAVLKTDVAIYDETLRDMVTLNKKALNPARANLTGRILSSKIFMPYSVTSGINPSQVPLMDANSAQGVSNSMVMMLDKIEQINNLNTVDNQFAGQRQGQREMTATQVLQNKAQADKSVGIIMKMMSLMEFKLSWLRLFNILENWFNPIDTEIDEARDMLKNKYRTVTREVPIEGKGLGNVMVMPTDEMMTMDEQVSMEDRLTKESGKPTRIILLNLKELNWSKIIWQIIIRPREKNNSEIAKLMTERFMAGLAFFGPTVNMGRVQEKYAGVWEEDPRKLFMDNSTAQIPSPNNASQTPNIPQPSNILNGNPLLK